MTTGDTKNQKINDMKKQLDEFRQIYKKLQDDEAAKKGEKSPAKKEKQEPPVVKKEAPKP